MWSWRWGGESREPWEVQRSTSTSQRENKKAQKHMKPGKWTSAQTLRNNAARLMWWSSNVSPHQATVLGLQIRDVPCTNFLLTDIVQTLQFRYRFSGAVVAWWFRKLSDAWWPDGFKNSVSQIIIYGRHDIKNYLVVVPVWSSSETLLLFHRNISLLTLERREEPEEFSGFYR